MSLEAKNITMDIKKSDCSEEYDSDSDYESASETGSKIESTSEFDSDCSDEYDTSFEMKIVNEKLDYYDIHLVNCDKKYITSVDKKFYESLPKIFTEYPQIIKTIISENSCNSSFFDIKIDNNSDIICQFIADMKFISHQIEMVFSYQMESSDDVISKMSIQLAKARRDIKALKKEIKDLANPKTEQWLIYGRDLEKELSEKEYDLYCRSVYTNRSGEICIEDFDLYTGYELSHMDKERYRSLSSSQSIKMITLTKTGNNFTIGSIDFTINHNIKYFDKFTNILSIPKGLFTFKTKIIKVIRLQICRVNSDYSHNTSCLKLQFISDTKKRVIEPILPEIYLELKKCKKQKKNSEYDYYCFNISHNDVDPSIYDRMKSRISANTGYSDKQSQNENYMDICKFFNDCKKDLHTFLFNCNRFGSSFTFKL